MSDNNNSSKDDKSFVKRVKDGIADGAGKAIGLGLVVGTLAFIGSGGNPFAAWEGFKWGAGAGASS